MAHKSCPNSIDDSFYLIDLNAILKISPPIRKKSLLDRFVEFCIVSIRKIPFINYWFIEFEKSEYLTFFKNEESVNYLRGYYVNPNPRSFNAYRWSLGWSYLPYIDSWNWAWTKEEAVNKIRLKYAIERIAHSCCVCRNQVADTVDSKSLNNPDSPYYLGWTPEDNMEWFNDINDVEIEINDTDNHLDYDAFERDAFQVYYIVYDLNTSSLRLEPEENWNDTNNVFPSDFWYIISQEDGMHLINDYTNELIHVLCYWINYSTYNLDIENITNRHKHNVIPFDENTYLIQTHWTHQSDSYARSEKELLYWALWLWNNDRYQAQKKYDRINAIEEMRRYLMENDMLCENSSDPSIPKFMFKLCRIVSGTSFKNGLVGVYTTDILRYSPYWYINSKRNLDKFLADNEETLLMIHYYDIDFK